VLNIAVQDILKSIIKTTNNIDDNIAIQAIEEEELELENEFLNSKF
jgi:hypothetical protein